MVNVVADGDDGSVEVESNKFNPRTIMDYLTFGKLGRSTGRRGTSIEKGSIGG